MSEPIRVLHVLQRMEAGGTQALLMNLYRNIDRTKIQFDFLVVYKEQQFYDEEIRSLGGRIYKFSLREDFNIFKFVRQLRNFFCEHKEYTIVHCHAYTFGYFFLKEAKRAGVPVRIAHSHNNETVHDLKYIPKLFLQKIYAIYATNLMACSEDAGTYLFGKKEFSVLKNAIDSKMFIANDEIRMEKRSELGLNGSFVIGTIGRLHPQKNQKFLIDCFSEIKRVKNNADLLIVGEGPLENELKNYVSDCGLKDSIHFLGVRKDIPEFLQALDVFVLPSLFEGLGIVAIEAQAAGVPVIASTGIPKEAEVTPLMKRIDLNAGREKWADIILEMSTTETVHENTQERIIASGYDTSDSALRMQKLYLDYSGKGA